MHRVFRSLLLALVFISHTTGAIAGIVNLNAGLGTLQQTVGDGNERTVYAIALLGGSYTTPLWEFTLDLPVRWDLDGWDFDERIWDRRGDWLRPLNTLRRTGVAGDWSVGLQTITSWTPGQGYLVRHLSGMGEVDYGLPSFLLSWKSDHLSLEAGMDRPVDPTVQAVAISWQPTERIRLIVEGAVDPDAPVLVGSMFTDGRPEAQSTERVTGLAAGTLLVLRDGKILDVSVGVHTGRLNDEARGLGTEVRVSLDLSPYYVSRLTIAAGSVQCEGGYVPSWFDGIYPVERWGLGGLETPLSLNPLDGSVEDRRMESVDLVFELGRFFRIAGGADRFTDDSMKRAHFLMELKEKGGRGLEASLWSKADEPGEDLFKEDRNLYSRISAVYAFFPHLLVRFSYDNSWAFMEDMGGLVPVTSLLVGAMYNISL
ncbi:MAG: hypothetical protein JSV00_00115 [bacterium]|nr:MAG: hypothetical protein JSV00_00115 [bacterium]